MTRCSFTTRAAHDCFGDGVFRLLFDHGHAAQHISAVEAFGRHEARLQKLSLKPSEYVQRQVRATPYPTEDVGWIAEQAGAMIPLFSSDYPHVEGGRNPLARFEASLATAGAETHDRFYRSNFEELMGPMLG